MKETHTIPRSLRIPTDLWEAARDKAHSEGKTLTQVVVAALKRYVRK